MSAQDVLLRYRWTKGEEIRYRLTTQSSSGGDLGIPVAGGSQLSMNQTTTETIHFVVEDVAADGKVTLREIIEAVRGDIEMSGLGTPGTKTSFDSANGAATDPAAQTAMAIVGVPITLIMSPTGEVEKVEGMAQVMQKLSAGMPPAAAGFLTQGFSDEAVKNMFADFPQFPARPVKAGDSWDRQRNISIPILGNISTTETYTMRGIENGIARIGVARKTNSEPANIGPITMKIEYVSSDGELLFDVARGRTQHLIGDTVQNINMTVTLPQGAPPGFSSPGPIKSSTKIEMELVK